MGSLEVKDQSGTAQHSEGEAPTPPASGRKARLWEIMSAVGPRSLTDRSGQLSLGLALVVLLSFAVRLPTLSAPVTEWRQAQTVLTTYWFTREGVSFLSYQTPIFGPPWQVPLEFPTFQATSAVLAKLLVVDVELASKIAVLSYFYLSALFLFLLCRRQTGNMRLSGIVLCVYLWFPFTIRYSREPLIDNAALAFALGYLYSLIVWLDHPRRLGLLILAIILGSLGYLTKITTMPIVVIPAAIAALRWLASRGFVSSSLGIRGIANLIKISWPSLAGLAAIAVLPAVAGYWWVVYADSIKQASPFTSWLTSQALSDWNYGTWEQKTTLANWLPWLAIVQSSFMPSIVMAFPLLGLLGLYRYNPTTRDLVASALVSPLLAIFIFFNLYRHDYYYIAISAYMAILVGFGLYHFFVILSRNRTWLIACAVIALSFPTMDGVGQIRTYWSAQRQAQADVAAAAPSTQLIRDITPEDEYVVLVQPDWDPAGIYSLRRKGLILSGQVIASAAPHVRILVKQHRFSTVVGDGSKKETQELLSYWRHNLPLAANVFKVSDQPILPSERRLVYKTGPFPSIAGGQPYRELAETLDVPLNQGEGYILRIEYANTPDAKPFAILGSGNDTQPFLVHASLPNQQSPTVAEFPFYVARPIPRPGLILRNWVDKGSMVVARVELYGTGPVQVGRAR